MRYQELSIVAAVTVLSFSPFSSAVAQGFSEEAIIKRMKEADKNKDGFIDRTEAKALPRLEKNFDQIDTNKDGKLSEEELLAFRSKNKK